MTSKSAKPDTLALLRERVKQAPTGPGVYRWLNADGTILYVGKAKNLRNRLRQYVNPAKGDSGPWRRAFLLQIADFDLTVTNSELEALILETNLIKELKPKYNVLMKDDKNYVYIRINVQDPFPRIDIVRRIFDDGAKYFGPKTSAEDARQTLAILRKIYPFRTCRMEIDPVDSNDQKHDANHADGQFDDASNCTDAPLGRPDQNSDFQIAIDVICRHKDRKTPCLDFHIEQCSAPCCGRKTSEEYYQESIAGVIDFLKGDEEPVKKLLQEKMQRAAQEKKFETAAQLRDHLRVLEGKKDSAVLVSDTSGEDSDIVGTALLASRAHVVVLHRRGGRITGEHSFGLSGNPESVEEVTEQFLAQFYAEETDIPPVIVTGGVPDPAVFEELLSARRGTKVKLLVPERGKKSQLLLLAEKNAAQKALQQEAKWEADKRNTESALEQLQELLHLPTLPNRIEGYDISHLGGTETVGSMVVMKHGKAANDHYRSFTIRTLKRGDIDDYWSLKEVLSRRLRRLTESLPQEEEKWKEQGISFGWVRKDERPTIETLLQENGEQIAEGTDLADCLVARTESELIGFVRLVEHSGTLTELASLWIAEPFRGGTLGQFLTRKILKSVKKGKVYAVIDASLEQSYAFLGFRYVIRPPKQLEEKLEKLQTDQPESPRIVMLWEALQNKQDTSFCEEPDLIMIDGGKGQLSAVYDVLQNMRLSIPVIGLAKREEEIFVPGRSEPILFPSDSPAKFLLMRLRDEAHRSANRHRKTRGLKALVASALDEIPGIGEETKRALLSRFKTTEGVRTASDSELKELLNESQLWELRNRLHP